MLSSAALLACTSTQAPAPRAAEPEPESAFTEARAEDVAKTEPLAPAPTPPPPTSFTLGGLQIELGSSEPWSAAPPHSSTHTPKLGTTWRLLRTIEVGVGYLSEAELSPNGEEVFVLSEQDGILRRYAVATGKLIQQIATPGFEEFSHVSFSLFPSEGGTTSLFRSTERGCEELSLPALESTTFPHCAKELRASGRSGLYGFSTWSSSPDFAGRLELLAGHDVKTLRAAEFAALILSSNQRIDGWSLTADGKKLALLTFPSDELLLLDLEQRKVILQIPAPQYAHGIALSPDGTRLAVGGSELRYYDAETGSLLTADSQYKNNIHELRFTPDAQLLLSSAYDGRARSYRPSPDALGAPQVLAHRGTANVYALGLDGEGKRLVTSSGDKSVKLWER